MRGGKEKVQHTITRARNISITDLEQFFGCETPDAQLAPKQQLKDAGIVSPLS